MPGLTRNAWFRLMAVTAMVVAQPLAAKVPAKPNVVFILADDLGWGDIGPFGQKIVPTPNLDRLATEGMILTSHYAGSTVCSPSRAALMTGRDTGHAAVRGNREVRGDSPQEEGQHPLPANTFTLATMFRNAGYATAAIGKWGLGSAVSSGAPWRQGFDYFYGYVDQRAAHGYFPTFLFRNDKVEQLENPRRPTNERLKGDQTDPASYARYVGPDYAQERLTSDAERYIAGRSADKTPFFLYLAYTLPHAEMQLPWAERARFQHLPERGPYLGRPYTPQQFPRAARAAMVARLDSDVGRILQQLKISGLDRNTLIVFTSDNGPTTEGGQDLEYFRSTGDWSGYKRDLYEGGIRMPTIVRWPGHVPAATRSNAVTAAWDWMPTLAKFAGAKVPRAPEARSFASALLGGRGPGLRPLYWEFHGAGAFPHIQAVRYGDWKAVRKWQGSEAKGVAPAVELYNLARDPAERLDLATRYPARARQLARMMERRVASEEASWNFEGQAEAE